MLNTCLKCNKKQFTKYDLNSFLETSLCSECLIESLEQPPVVEYNLPYADA